MLTDHDRQADREVVGRADVEGGRQVGDRPTRRSGADRDGRRASYWLSIYGPRDRTRALDDYLTQGARLSTGSGVAHYPRVALYPMDVGFQLLALQLRRIHRTAVHYQWARPKAADREAGFAIVDRRPTSDPRTAPEAPRCASTVSIRTISHPPHPEDPSPMPVPIVEFTDERLANGLA